MRRRQAARAAAVSSRGWLAWTATTTVLPSHLSARANAGVMRSGSATGMRVCQRSVFTCGIAAMASVVAAIRRGDKVSGSPPVRMTSQIAGRART